MKKSLIITIVLAAVLVVGYFFLPKNVSVQANSLTKPEIEEIVRNFILDNPEVIVESMQNYQVKQQQQAQMKASEAVKNIDLASLDNVPTIGAEDGDVVVMEFFDYNCGYCKRVLPTVTKLIEEDKNVTVKMMEFPILSPGSQMAAKAALAVYQVSPNKYFDYHTKVMDMKGEKNNEALLELAKSLGIDRAKVEEKMDSPEVKNALQEIRGIAQQVQISGTPAFIVGNQLIPGAVGLDELKAAVESARNN